MCQNLTLNDGNATKEHTKFVVLALHTFLCGKNPNNKRFTSTTYRSINKFLPFFSSVSLLILTLQPTLPPVDPLLFLCTFTVYPSTIPISPLQNLHPRYLPPIYDLCILCASPYISLYVPLNIHCMSSSISAYISTMSPVYPPVFSLCWISHWLNWVELMTFWVQ